MPARLHPAIVALLLGAAPVGAVYGMQSGSRDQDEIVGRAATAKRVWPDAPEVPRIAFRATLTSGRDIGKGLSGFAKFRAMLAGTRETVSPVQRPYGVVVGADRRVYITDGMRNQLLVFDPKVRVAKPLGLAGQGRLVKPMGLAVDRAGNVYVADPGGKRVVAFTPGDTFLRSYGSADLLLNPVGFAVDNTAGLVYVADSFLHQVLVFRQSDGSLIRRIGRDEGEASAKQRSMAATPTRLVNFSPNILGSGGRARPEWWFNTTTKERGCYVICHTASGGTGGKNHYGYSYKPTTGDLP